VFAGSSIRRLAQVQSARSHADAGSRIGLPNRFGIAFENSIENHRGRTQDRTFTSKAAMPAIGTRSRSTRRSSWKQIRVGDILHDRGRRKWCRKAKAGVPQEQELPMPSKCDLLAQIQQQWMAANFFSEQNHATAAAKWILQSISPHLSSNDA